MKNDMPNGLAIRKWYYNKYKWGRHKSMILQNMLPWETCHVRADTLDSKALKALWLSTTQWLKRRLNFKACCHFRIHSFLKPLRVRNSGQNVARTLVIICSIYLSNFVWIERLFLSIFLNYSKFIINDPKYERIHFLNARYLSIFLHQ